MELNKSQLSKATANRRGSGSGGDGGGQSTPGKLKRAPGSTPIKKKNKSGGNPKGMNKASSTG